MILITEMKHSEYDTTSSIVMVASAESRLMGVVVPKENLTLQTMENKITKQRDLFLKHCK